MIIPQPLTAKIGEVKYRNKLSSQHQGKNNYFPEEYNSKEIKKIILEKIKRIQIDFTALKKEKVIFSPFLEIGAERGQASLLLTNKFKARGYASDIAKEPLHNIKNLSNNLTYEKCPKILICDAENLPFADNSFAFIFCYQTLHHFNHPLTVTSEICRILKPGGWFFFAEEPVKQWFNIPLWYRPTKLRWWEKILKILLILPFISKIGKTEIDHGILENTFSMTQWKQALEIFEKVNTEIKPYPFGQTGKLSKNGFIWKNINLLSKIFIFLLGGGISGLMQKHDNLIQNKLSSNTLPQLVCIRCGLKKNNTTINSFLVKKSQKLVCPKCNNVYPISNKIPIVLSKKLIDLLYPDI